MPPCSTYARVGTAVHSPHPVAFNSNIKNECYIPIIECDEHLSIKVNICGNNAEIRIWLMKGDSKRKPNLRLKHERELRGWSQGDVAEKIGAEGQTVISGWQGIR